jgi:nucleotide-binding universal stress UspA family protein
LIAPTQLRTIVVPMDFSAHARHALAAARGLAERAGPAHLILVTAYFIPVELEALGVPDESRVLRELETRAARDLEQLLVGLQDAGVSSEYLTQRGAPAPVILEIARSKHADLIVMGTHGRTGIEHALLGSVAERVLREAPCPVLCVK